MALGKLFGRGKKEDGPSPEGGAEDGQEPGRKGGGPKRGQQDRPQNFTAKSREPDPDSPFAVLAGLKLKS